MKNALRYVALGLFIVGFLCMPFPVTNPGALTSIFSWIVMTGSLIRYGLWAMALGAVLFTLSFVFPRRH